MGPGAENLEKRQNSPELLQNSRRILAEPCGTLPQSLRPEPTWAETPSLSAVGKLKMQVAPFGPNTSPPIGALPLQKLPPSSFAGAYLVSYRRRCSRWGGSENRTRWEGAMWLRAFHVAKNTLTCPNSSELLL